MHSWNRDICFYFPKISRIFPSRFSTENSGAGRKKCRKLPMIFVFSSLHSVLCQNCSLSHAAMLWWWHKTFVIIKHPSFTWIRKRFYFYRLETTRMFERNINSLPQTSIDSVVFVLTSETLSRKHHNIAFLQLYFKCRRDQTKQSFRFTYYKS